MDLRQSSIAFLPLVETYWKNVHWIRLSYFSYRGKRQYCWWILVRVGESSFERCEGCPILRALCEGWVEEFVGRDPDHRFLVVSAFTREISILLNLHMLFFKQISRTQIAAFSMSIQMAAAKNIKGVCHREPLCPL